MSPTDQLRRYIPIVAPLILIASGSAPIAAAPSIWLTPDLRQMS
jgi:hypothetical protein